MSIKTIFLSYHSPDREAVQTVKRLLEPRGISAFLDREDLVPGLPWPRALEDALRSVRAVAVFIGPHDLGLWQKREMWFALDRQVQEERAGRLLPVIPVLLPGADPTSGFLFLNTWVDLRQDLTDPEALDELARAVWGEAEVRPEEVRVTLCPYRGLRPFREEDGAFFFGREAFSERLVEAVQGQNLVAVLGPSGSGKSSVVQARLLPRLGRQRPPAETWDAIMFTPGDRPFHRLAAALTVLLEPDLSEVDRLAEAQKLGDRLERGEVYLENAVERLLAKSEGTDRLMLVADQFEELFTLTPKTGRKPFVEALLQALDRAPLSLVLILRADFYGHAIALSRDLSDRVEQGVVNLGPMTREELERAIVEPARRAALTFEPGLVQRILDDVGEEPGNLPLLEFALTELWARRQGGLLTHAAYEDIGGVTRAIAQRAEAVFKSFTAEQQDIGRRVFTRLVRVARPEEGTEETRQRVNLSDLGEEARPVVKALADARLVVTGRDEATGEETAEVAHEALIRGWSQLRGWVDEDREFLLWRQRLRVTLAEWDRTGRDEGVLLRGALLAEAERWLAERPDNLNPDERAYIQRSRARRGREEQRWRELNEETERQRRAAQARELASRAELERGTSGESLVRRVLLAVESLRRSPTPEGYQVLRHALALLPSAPLTCVEHEGEVYAVAFSPDGRWLATGSNDRTARVWEVASGQEVARMLHKDAVRAVTFSPDGRWLATASGDMARVVEAATGHQVARMRHKEVVVWAVAFSPDGRWLATGSEYGAAWVWVAATGRKIARIVHDDRDDRAVAVAFSPDGRMLAIVSRGSHGFFSVLEAGISHGFLAEIIERIFKVKEGVFSYRSEAVIFIGHKELVYAGAFSLNGRWLATVSADRTARVWEVATLHEVARMEHEGEVYAVAFSPDGRWLATGSNDRTARVWEVATGREVARMPHEDVVRATAFSSDGRWLATASGDMARVVEAATGWETVFGWEAIWMEHEGAVRAIAFSPDGRWLATGSGGILSGSGEARVWEAATGQEVSRMVHRYRVSDVAFNPDGRWLATVGDDRTVRVWEAATGQEVSEMVHEYQVRAVALSPDGVWLATGSEDNTARVWEVATGQEVARMIHEDDVESVAFSPDGCWLATGSGGILSGSGEARVWEAATGREGVRMPHEYPVWAVAFSPDGHWLVTRGGGILPGSGDEALVWDMATGREVARMTHEGRVLSVAFSPDGCWLATGSVDGTARVWDTATGREVARMVHDYEVVAVAFSPDGRWLATGSWDATARVWLWRPEDLITEACARLTRNLSREEWQQYIGNEPYRPTCPNLPVPEE